MKIKSRQTKGFTLPELLLSIAVLGMIAGMSAPIYQAFYVKNDLEIAAASFAHSLRRAQVLAQAMDGDSQWGVSIQPSSIVLYRGTSYASRTASYDEITDFPASISASGLTEVAFQKLSGLPQATGTATLTSTNSDVRNIAINEKGIVSY